MITVFSVVRLCRFYCTQLEMAAIQKTIRRVVTTTKTASPLAPYNKGIQVDKTLYVSGQVGLDPKVRERVISCSVINHVLDRRVSRRRCGVPNYSG